MRSLRHAFLTLEQIRREEGMTARVYSAAGNTMMISSSFWLLVKGPIYGGAVMRLLRYVVEARAYKR